MEGRPGMKAGRPFTMVSALLLNMGECAINSLGVTYIDRWTAWRDRIASCAASYGSIDGLLLGGPHVAGVTVAVLASPNANLSLIGLARGTLVGNMRIDVVVVGRKHGIIVLV